MKNKNQKKQANLAKKNKELEKSNYKLYKYFL